MTSRSQVQPCDRVRVLQTTTQASKALGCLSSVTTDTRNLLLFETPASGCLKKKDNLSLLLLPRKSQKKTPNDKRKGDPSHSMRRQRVVWGTKARSTMRGWEWGEVMTNRSRRFLFKTSFFSECTSLMSTYFLLMKRLSMLNLNTNYSTFFSADGSNFLLPKLPPCDLLSYYWAGQWSRAAVATSPRHSLRHRRHVAADIRLSWRAGWLLIKNLCWHGSLWIKAYHVDGVQSTFPTNFVRASRAFCSVDSETCGCLPQAFTSCWNICQTLSHILWIQLRRRSKKAGQSLYTQYKKKTQAKKKQQPNKKNKK